MTNKFTVLFSALARERFDDIVRGDRKKGIQLAQAIDRLSERPSLGVPLRGEWKGYLKYRTGDYRIIFRIERERIVIFIVTIGNRKDVYR